MLALWQEVLGIPDLGVEDDYSAAGGTSLLAARLFSLVTQRFGVRLPLTTILDHSTVRKLAGAIRADRPQTGPLIELRPDGLKNFFFVHDGDGETLLYGNVARRLPNQFAVFGIEPRQLRGIPLAHARIEDMASYYIEVIRQKQPHGPYFVGGMCAGGVIAYEMARQLEAVGEDVELVVLLNSAMPTTPKRHGRIARQRMGRLRQVVAERGGKGNPLELVMEVLRKFFNAAVWEIVLRVRRWSVFGRFRLLRFLLDRNLAWPSLVPELTVRQIYDAAESGYLPRPAPLPAVMLVRARAGQGGDAPFREVYADETLGWECVIDHLLIEDVDGGHYTMLQEPFAEKVAERMAAVLDPKPTARTTDLLSRSVHDKAGCCDRNRHLQVGRSDDRLPSIDRKRARCVQFEYRGDRGRQCVRGWTADREGDRRQWLVVVGEACGRAQERRFCLRQQSGNPGSQSSGATAILSSLESRHDPARRRHRQALSRFSTPIRRWELPAAASKTSMAAIGRSPSVSRRS